MQHDMIQAYRDHHHNKLIYVSVGTDCTDRDIDYLTDNLPGIAFCPSIKLISDNPPYISEVLAL